MTTDVEALLDDTAKRVDSLAQEQKIGECSVALSLSDWGMVLSEIARLRAELAEALEVVRPRLNTKSLQLVKEWAEAAHAMGSGKLGAALDLLLEMHDRAAAWYERNKG